MLRSAFLVYLAAAIACNDSDTRARPASAPAVAPTEATAARPPAPAATRPPEPAEDPVMVGAKLSVSKGCTACHSIDGKPYVGPTFKAAYGRNVALADGTTLTFDDAYFRESVLSPQVKLVAGYPPSQPSYQGQLTDAELAALLAYVKSLR